MNELPSGWAMATLEELTDPSRPICYGILMPKEHIDGGVPIVKVKDFSRGPLDVSTLRRTAPEIAAKYSRSSLAGGDVLVSIRGTYGRVVVVPDSLAGGNITQDTARLAPVGLLDRRFLASFLLSPGAQQYFKRVARGVAVKGVNIGDLKQLATPLPPLPEQRRIVAALEEHLSRLDAAQSAALSAERRIRGLERSIITEASATLDPLRHWRVATVAEAGEVKLGLQRSPKRHSGPNMRPYLRVANVFEDRIDDSDVMAMDISDAEWERYQLRDGDVLLNEGQSPEFLGRPAMYRGDPPAVAFTNSLIRFKANEGVDPEWALLVFRSHMHNGRFMRESQITTNIAHLAAGRFKTVEFPLPPIEEQRARVAMARARLDACARLRSEVEDSLSRAAALRRSILAAAFSGQLVPQDPDDEPASVLLERIRAERQASHAPKRRTRS